MESGSRPARAAQRQIRSRTRETFPAMSTAEAIRNYNPRAFYHPVEMGTAERRQKCYHRLHPTWLENPLKHPGKLITFEGLDGCGKSTQLALEAERLRQQGLPVTTTQEPGGTPIGQQIRDLVVQPASEAVTPSAELAL